MGLYKAPDTPITAGRLVKGPEICLSGPWMGLRSRLVCEFPGGWTVPNQGGLTSEPWAYRQDSACLASCKHNEALGSFDRCCQDPCPTSTETKHLKFSVVQETIYSI